MSWSKSSFSPDPGVKYRSCRACEFHNGMTRRQELFAPPPWEKHTCHSLNGLSLRHTIHTRKKRPQYSEEEYTTLQTKLRPFDGPFPYGTYDEDEEFAVNMRNAICTSMPSCELMGFPALVSRKRVALRILKNTLNVNLGPSHAVRITRDQYEKTFRYEFELLERLLRQTWAVHISNGDLGVRIDSSIFSQLQAALRRRKQQASRSLVIHEIDLDCPTWGQDISLFMTENDFELYSLCYRASIEYFLSDMDNHHDWETGKPWPTYEELRQHGSKLTHSMRTIADRSEQLKPAATRHCLRSEPSQSSLLLESTPNISVKPHSTSGNCTDGLIDVSVKASTTSTGQPQSQLKHKLASVPKLDETFNCRNSSNKSGASSSQVYTEQTEDSQSTTSVKTAPILPSTYLQSAIHTVGSSSCDLTTTATIETNPEVARCDSRVYTELQRDSYSVHTCDMPTKSQSPIGPTNGSLDVSLPTSRLPSTLKVPSAAGFQLSRGNQHILPEGIATQTQTEATKENSTMLKISNRTGQMIDSRKESPTVPLASQSKPHQSKSPCQNVASDLNSGEIGGTITGEEEQYHHKKRGPNLEALDYNTNASIDQNLMGSKIHTFRIASETPCTPFPETNRNTLLPTHLQSMASQDVSSHDTSTCVTAPGKAFTSEPLHSFCPLKADTSSPTVEATCKETSMNLRNTGDTMLEAPTPAGQITSSMKEKPMLSEPGEEKTLSRKIRRAREKERKTADKEKRTSLDCAKTEQVQLLPNGTMVEHPQTLKLERITQKHTSAANQENQNIKLGTSLNHVSFSIVSVPTKSPDLASGNTHVDLLGHPNLAWLSESPRIVMAQEHNIHALASTVERTGQHLRNTCEIKTGEGNQCILLKAVATPMQQSKTDTVKERNHKVLKQSTHGVCITDPVERIPIISQAAEEKTLRELEEELKTDHQQELLLSPVAAETEQESKRLLAERLQSAVFRIAPSKHKLPGKSEYDQSNRNIQFRTSSSDVPWYISITPIIASQALLSENTRIAYSTDHIPDRDAHRHRTYGGYGYRIYGTVPVPSEPWTARVRYGLRYGCDPYNP